MSHLAPLRQISLQRGCQMLFLALIVMINPPWVEMEATEMEMEMALAVDSDGQPSFFSQALSGDR